MTRLSRQMEWAESILKVINNLSHFITKLSFSAEIDAELKTAYFEAKYACPNQDELCKGMDMCRL